MKQNYKTGKRRMATGKRIAVAFVLMALIMPLSNTMAQVMNVHESGAVTTYDLSNISSMRFSAGNVTVNTLENGTATFALSGVDKLTFTHIINSTTDIQQEDVPLLVAFPNPVKNVLNLNINGNGLAGQVHIVSLSGQLMQSVAVQTNKGMQINVSELPSGMYICRYVNGAEYQTVKFIKH